MYIHNFTPSVYQSRLLFSLYFYFLFLNFFILYFIFYFFISLLVYITLILLTTVMCNYCLLLYLYCFFTTGCRYKNTFHCTMYNCACDKIKIILSQRGKDYCSCCSQDLEMVKTATVKTGVKPDCVTP